MKALELTGPGKLRIGDRSLPRARPDQRILSVSRCALCSSDAKMWSNGHRDLVLPRVLGHEICGTLEGHDRRFVVWPGTACGTCEHCAAGSENLCEKMSILGFNRDGGLAEKVAVDEYALIPVPEHVPSAVACLAEPLACALNALDRIGLCAGETLAVFGGGPVGMLMALAARERRATPFLVEPDPTKRAAGQVFRERLAMQGGKECTSGPFDAAVNAASQSEALFSGLVHLKARGRFAFFSGLPNSSPIPAQVLNEIHYRQLVMTGAYGCTREHMVAAVSLLERFYEEVSLLVEREVRLEEVQAVLPDIRAGNTMRIVVDPTR